MATNNVINTGKPIEVTKGGTGVATMTTAYAPVCAGTTATGALQVASTGLATPGFVWTSNGASALPSFQAAPGAGSVSGPGSSTDRSIVSWNGTGGTALFDNANTQIDASGNMTNSAQPAFKAIMSTGVANVTGNGTLYSIIFDIALFDQGGHYNSSTGIFTAPVTGIYFFHTEIGYSGASPSYTGASTQIEANSGIVSLITYNPTTITSNPSIVEVMFAQSGMIKLSAGDTVHCSIILTGAASDDVTVGGGTSYFSGYLIC